ENRGGGGGTVGAAAVVGGGAGGVTPIGPSPPPGPPPGHFPQAPPETAGGFCAVCAFGRLRHGTRVEPRKGRQKIPPRRRRPHGQARLDHIWHCRRRLGDPHLRRDIALQRRL